MLEYIKFQDQLFSIIIRAGYDAEGIKFFTPNDLSQQLAYMKRPKGYLIQPHIHNPVPREVSFTHEVLFIRRGVVKVNFFSPVKEFIESRTLIAGDVILLAGGGHGFEIIEEAEIIEVKQGPYAGEGDKIRF